MDETRRFVIFWSSDYFARYCTRLHLKTRLIRRLASFILVTLGRMYYIAKIQYLFGRTVARKLQIFYMAYGVQLQLSIIGALKRSTAKCCSQTSQSRWVFKTCIVIVKIQLILLTRACLYFIMR